MIRILAISRASWRNDNNTGNTFTDFFKDFPDAEVYSLCMREQPPQNDIAKRHFYISERQMIKRLLGQKSSVGAENSSKSMDDSVETKIYNMAKRHTNTFLMMAREMLWTVGGWKNEALRSYIQDVSPDIVFFPVFGCYYPHKVLKYIHSLCEAKIVLFHADDNYTLKQFSLSPFYWIYRFGLRKWIKRTVRIADLQYCISNVQKLDYERSFGCECKLLTKFADFSGDPKLKNTFGVPLQLVFTGNININRWKSLAMLVRVLERVNKDETRAQLRIYTATPCTKKMTKALCVGNTSFLMKPVPAGDIARIQGDADILVHAEGTDIKSRLIVRQSFSTKIVDYMNAARPIVAVGPKEVASIKHLIENNCAIVADNEKELYSKMNAVISNVRIMNEYAMKAFLCGVAHHNRRHQQAMLHQDLQELAKK